MDELKKFIRINAKENDVYKKLFSELKENEISVYSVEPERTFIKNKNIEIVTYPHYIRIDEDACEDIEELIEKYGEDIEYSEYNLIAKYFIAFGHTENIRSDSKVTYKDIIGKFDTFEGAAEVYDKIYKYYSGLQNIVFFAEFYDLDADENEVLVCYDVFDEFRNLREESYSIVSANIVFDYNEECGMTCTLGKTFLEYGNLETAQEVFDVLKSIYSGEKDLSELKTSPYREMIEIGMIANIQETLNLFYTEYEKLTCEPILVKEFYKLGDNCEMSLINKRIVDCIEEDNRY